MPASDKRIIKHLHADAQVIATLAFRFWGVLSGGITLTLIPFLMGSVEQGYYFTFASILALQVFFELGFGQVIIQFVAHEAALLQKSHSGEYRGPESTLSRLTTLTATLRWWYYISSVFFFIAVNLVGIWFFRGNELPWSQWLLPWMLLVTATTYNLSISWRLSLIEGFGLVKEVGLLRLGQSAVGFFVMWVALAAGAQLWVVAAVPIAAAFYTTFWLRTSEAARLLPALEKNDAFPRVPGIWRREIFPFQWRIAVSWISGFFIFQLFTPIIFKHYGAIESGKIGLAITVFNSVTTVSIAWVSAKIPTLAQLLAQGHVGQASLRFKQLARVSMAFAVLAATIVTLAGSSLAELSPRIDSRLPSANVMIALALASIANCFVIACALFMRAHKEEPMLSQSVVMALCTLVAVYLSTPYGTTWIMWSYAALCWGLGVPWTVLILVKRYYIADQERQASV